MPITNYKYAINNIIHIFFIKFSKKDKTILFTKTQNLNIIDANLNIRSNKISMLKNY